MVVLYLNYVGDIILLSFIFFGLSPLEADMLGSVLPELPRRYHTALFHFFFIFVPPLGVASSCWFHGFSFLCLLTLARIKRYYAI